MRPKSFVARGQSYLGQKRTGKATSQETTKEEIHALKKFVSPRKECKLYDPG